MVVLLWIRVVIEEDRPLICHEYPCEWDATTNRIVGLKEFGALVYGDLLASVIAQFGDVPERKEAQTDEEIFAEEAEQMEAFIEDRTERYILGSRDPLMRDMLARQDTSEMDRFTICRMCVIGVCSNCPLPTTVSKRDR